MFFIFFFQAEDGIRDKLVTGVQTCALPISGPASSMAAAVPSRRPVPIEPPTATMVICAALSWWRRPNSASVAGDAMVVCTGKAMPGSGSSRYADPSSDVATASASGAFIIRSRNLRLYYGCDAREPCSVVRFRHCTRWGPKPELPIEPEAEPTNNLCLESAALLHPKEPRLGPSVRDAPRACALERF